jgi:hypothetical protein
LLAAVLEVVLSTVAVAAQVVCLQVMRVFNPALLTLLLSVPVGQQRHRAQLEVLEVILYLTLQLLAHLLGVFKQLEAATVVVVGK